jgi:hypothetical protein
MPLISSKPGPLFLFLPRLVAAVLFVAGLLSLTTSGPKFGTSQRQTNLENLGTDFRLVLMWPTWPQLAHLRAVPSLLRPLPGLEDVGAAVGAGVGAPASETLGDPGPGPGDAAAGLPAAEALAMLRALRRSR